MFPSALRRSAPTLRRALSSNPPPSTRDRLVSLFQITKPNPNPKPTHDENGETFASRNGLRTLFIGSVTLCFIAYGVFKPVHVPLLDELTYDAFPVEWVEVLDKDEDGQTGLKDGTYKVLTMRMPDNHPKVKGNVDTNEEGIYHLMVKDPSLQIERPYTIFSPPEHITGLPTQLSILVKREPQGEVSRFIHSLQRFSWLEIRGPIPTQTEIVRPPSIESDPDLARLKGWSLEGWDRVLMISGGTGITPFVQLLHTLTPPERAYNPLNPPKPPPELPTITLVHTSTDLPLALLEDHLPDPTRLPAKLELADLSPGRFRLDEVKKLLVPEEDAPRASFWGSLWKENLVEGGKVSEPGRPSALVDGQKTLVLVSGPDGMIEAVAGQRGRPLGGLVGSLGWETDKVEVRRFWNQERRAL